MITPTWSEVDDFCTELYERRLVQSGQQLNDFCSEYLNFWSQLDYF